MSCFSIKTFKCIVWFFPPLNIDASSSTGDHAAIFTLHQSHLKKFEISILIKCQWFSGPCPTHRKNQRSVDTQGILTTFMHNDSWFHQSSVRLWITRFFLIYSVHHMFNTYFQESPNEVKNIEVLFIFIIYRANLKKWQHINTISIHWINKGSNSDTTNNLKGQIVAFYIFLLLSKTCMHN